MTWLASLEGGDEIIAEGQTLEDVYKCLELLGLVEETRVVLFNTEGRN